MDGCDNAMMTMQKGFSGFIRFVGETRKVAGEKQDLPRGTDNPGTNGHKVEEIKLDVRDDDGLADGDIEMGKREPQKDNDDVAGSGRIFNDDVDGSVVRSYADVVKECGVSDVKKSTDDGTNRKVSTNGTEGKR